MKLRTFAVLGLSLLATAGCRSDPAIPILERQLRLQEDEIYRLRATIDNMQDDSRVIEKHEGDPSRSHEAEESDRNRFHHNHDTGPNGSEMPPVNVELPGASGTTVPKELLPRKGSLPPDFPPVPEGLEGPSRRTMPGPAEKGSGSMSPPDASQDGPSIEMGRRGRPHIAMTVAAPTDSGVAFVPKGDSQHVASIVLNRSLTGGINDGDGDGDQGLLVVVEPRDSRGRVIDAPAKVSVALLDPAVLDEQGNAVRLALWEFSEAETASMFRRVGSSEGIHLAMAWPEEPPKHDKLHLFVRYVTSDGRMLEAHHPIEVTLQSERTARRDQFDTRVRADAPEELGPPAEAMHPIEPPAERISERSPHMAARSRDTEPGRPVWSPERR